MLIDFEKITPHERYKLLTAAVVPRPIALVSTLTPDGVVNAAPFSFFNVFSEDPALAILGLQHAPDGSIKHTTQHILDNGEFVINLVDRQLAEAMAVCAARFPADVSEIEAAGLSVSSSRHIKTPRITEAPVALECRTWEIRQITPTRHLAIGEIVALSARDGLVDPGNTYTSTCRPMSLSGAWSPTPIVILTIGLSSRYQRGRTDLPTRHKHKAKPRTTHHRQEKHDGKTD